MPIYFRKISPIRAEHWLHPANPPPAPPERTRLREHGWEIQLYSGWKPVPLNGWILYMDDGSIDTLSNEEFCNSYVSSTDSKAQTSYDLIYLAHKVIYHLRGVFGMNYVSVENAEEKVKAIIERMQFAETKSKWWDHLPLACKRLGVKYEEIRDLVMTATRSHK